MPKDRSDDKSVFDMISSLRDRYGSAAPEQPEAPEEAEEIEETDALEETEPAETPEAEDAPLSEAETAQEAPADAPEDEPLVPDDTPEEVPEIAEEPADEQKPDAPAEDEAESPAEVPADEPEALFEESKNAADEPEESLPEEEEEPAPEAEETAEEISDETLPEETESLQKEDETGTLPPEDNIPDDDVLTELLTLSEDSETDLSEEENEPIEEALSEDESSDETPQEDEVSIDQLSLEMPEAEPAPAAVSEAEDKAEAPESDAPDTSVSASEPEPQKAQESAPAPEAPEASVSAPAVKKPSLMRTPSMAVGKPIPSEQMSMENLPRMPGNSAMSLPEDQPSVESLERSSPDLSALSDEKRLNRSGLSEQDIRMMLEFGYEDDLRHVLGNRTVRKIKYPGDALEQTRQDIRPYAYSGKEYDGSSEGRDKVLATYKKEKSFLVWRLVVTAVCTLLLLFLDVWAEKIIAWPLPILPALFGIAILLLAAAFSHRALAGGYKSLVYFAPTPHAIPAIFLPIALVLNLVSAFLPTFPCPAVNFPVALLLSLSALGDAFRFSTEKRSFLVVSSAEGKKIVIDPYLRRRKKLQIEDKILCLIDDNPGNPEYRVKPAERVTGFFRRVGNLSGSVRFFSLSLSISFGVAALGGLVAWIFSDGILPTLSVFINALFFASPTSVIFAFFYPARLASGELARKRVALVGEESIAELSEKNTLLFADTLAFSEKDCTGSSVRKDTDTAEDLRLAGILFRKLGGVPAEVAAPLFPEGPDPAVSIIRIRDDGIEALVENRYHMMVGSRDYLLRCGIRCPAEPKTKTWQSAATAELFVAIDEVVKLQYKLEYGKKQEFEALLERLKAAGVESGIFTYDPSLNEAFLSRLYGNDAPFSVVKPGAFDTEPELTITDSPVVALGNESDLADPIEAAASIRRARKFSFRIQWVASLLGAAYATVCGLWGKASLVGLGAFSIFQLAVLLLTWAVETAQLRKKQS